MHRKCLEVFRTPSVCKGNRVIFVFGRHFCLKKSWLEFLSIIRHTIEFLSTVLTIKNRLFDHPRSTEVAAAVFF